MSTYLVALLVGDFVCRESRADDTPIRVCATPDKLELTAFALEAAEFELAWFNDYFGIPYPYDKLDIIGVPDFAAGAMENAGAITFRERLLLVDEASCVDRRAQGRGLGHRARARPPVVRQPGDDEMVGRHLAERRLRDLGGQQAAGRLEARVAHGAERRRRDADRARRSTRCAPRAPSAPRSRRRPRSTRCSIRSPTRRPRV